MIKKMGGLSFQIHLGEEIYIGDDVMLRFFRRKNESMLRVAIWAPKELKINRKRIEEDEQVTPRDVPEKKE